MSGLSWLLVAAALLLVPLGDPLAERWTHLAARGRLVAPAASHRTGRGRTPSERWSGGAVVVAVTTASFGGATIRAGPAVGLAAAIAAAVAGRTLLSSMRRRSRQRGDARLLAALRVLVAELAAGASPDAALSAAGSLDASRADEFEAAAAAVRSGTEVGPEFGEHPHLQLVGQAWTVAAATGAALADVLSRVADDLAARLEQADAVSAALAGPRSSALLLAGLPALGVALGMAMQSDPLQFLFGVPAGRLVLLLGVALDAAGVLWTGRLADRAERP